jgi:xanthine dehydrogenase accessory factor
MINLATTAEDILAFLLSRANEGLATALVTLTAVQGSSPRSIGSQMAICEDGRYLGSFSGGCIEAAVVAEAQKVIKSGRVTIVRIGAGSPYIDVRLPCGGGIDLLFTPNPDMTVIAQTRALLKARKACVLTLSDLGIRTGNCPRAAGCNDNEFTVLYKPRLRVVAIGQGEELVATARLAQFFGAETQVFSPAQRDIATIETDGISSTLLAFRTAKPVLHTDSWTAFIFLFHDHDWEEILLPWAMALPQFYIGAMGSRRSHAARLEMLDAAGVDKTTIAMLRPQVGLIPSTRDPATLALSIVSEIVQEYNRLNATLTL